MIKLSAQYSEAQENIEEYANIFAKNEKEIMHMKKEFFYQTELMDFENQEIKKRAEVLEEENIRVGLFFYK